MCVYVCALFLVMQFFIIFDSMIITKFYHYCQVFNNNKCGVTLSRFLTDKRPTKMTWPMWGCSVTATSSWQRCCCISSGQWREPSGKVRDRIECCCTTSREEGVPRCLVLTLTFVWKTRKRVTTTNKRCWSVIPKRSIRFVVVSVSSLRWYMLANIFLYNLGFVHSSLHLCVSYQAWCRRDSLTSEFAISWQLKSKCDRHDNQQNFTNDHLLFIGSSVKEILWFVITVTWKMCT